MKIIGFNTKSSDRKFYEKEVSNIIEIGDSDVLVQIKAISVNPADYKVRFMNHQADEFKVIGWDASGIIEKVGKNVKNFKVGDEVFYAGDLTRQGCNAEYQVIDQSLIAKKPKSLSFLEAAALPLTSLTVFEGLFERLSIKDSDHGKNILILGGAGGVGSVAIQVAKNIAKLNVIATASRDDSIEWCKKMGADIVINHREDMVKQLNDLNFLEKIDYVFCCADASAYGGEIFAKIMRPFGKLCAIVEQKNLFDLTKFQMKSLSFCWEWMFTKSFFKIQMESQNEILSKVADLVDSGVMKHTLHTSFDSMTPENLEEVHKILMGGHTIGKICLAV